MTLRRVLTEEGYIVKVEKRGDSGLALAQQDSFDVVITDMKLPGLSGLELVRELHMSKPRLPIILMTAHGTTDTAIEATKSGAYDYLLKPFEMPELIELVEKAVASLRLMTEPVELGEAGTARDALIGNSRLMHAIYKEIGRIASKPVNVLIRGETGTGKEHVARLVHALSPRSSKPFVELHCGSLPESILESELFGYEPGAFTDAKRQKQGLFEEAQGGSIFLDEIGELTPSVQMKLLKVLEQKTIRRLGGNREIPLDVRIITATHRNLEQEVKGGRFRADLFYRLNVIPLHIPALRERPNDIVQLANFFFQESCRGFNKKLSLLSDDVLTLLKNYSWPGNVRELKHVIERLVITAKGSTLSAKDLPKEIREAKTAPPAGKGVLSKNEAELENIKRALMETKDNKSKAAKILGLVFA
jgi:DNA-binding NtrC family response regulator